MRYVGRPARNLGSKCFHSYVWGQIYDPVEPAVVHVYAVYLWGGEPVNAAPDEHTEVCWFSPRGHIMEFVRPGLGPNVLPARDVDRRGDDEVVKVAGWPVATQHPRGRDGTVFVTILDETGDVQVIVWHDRFGKRRREVRSQAVEVTGRVSRWDGTTNVIATELRAIRSGIVMPPSHD